MIYTFIHALRDILALYPIKRLLSQTLSVEFLIAFRWYVKQVLVSIPMGFQILYVICFQIMVP